MEKPTVAGDYPKRVTNAMKWFNLILNASHQNNLEIDIDMQIKKITLEYSLGNGKPLKNHANFLFEKGYLSNTSGVVTILKKIDF